MSNALYDLIGIDYADLRKPDLRIAQRIDEALGQARRVLNVGAGAGSYEPENRHVTAVEPSATMIAQRPESATEVVQAIAEALPFRDHSFEASMAILTIHHWSDQEQGLREMCRVTSGPLVIVTFDPAFRGFWLTDYFPGLISLDEEQMPDMASLREWLGDVTVTNLPIPADCSDGFLSAYWKRPSAYLDPRIRAAMSPFWALGDITDQLKTLEQDISSGAWAKRYAVLQELDECDCGYRLITADCT